ncbi:MAG: NAD(P)H-hydrate dehydratase [Deltaproteobacteria bacterium]|nr:NAD(P)H-hydrate dehydratase [Deltaproteobacteria bacterium]MBW2070843.1 NAD(P)H-hydrate dehydratase [Deltaproteobacteria bacterium]
MRVVTAEEMTAMDRAAIDTLGIPGVVLMENAGKGAAEVLQNHFPHLEGKRLLVVAGGGNNGGDGFVIARHLWQQRLDVVVCCLKEPEAYRGDARTNLTIIQRLGVPIEVRTRADGITALRPLVESADLIVDAIFGTGLNAPVRGYYRDVIELINGAAAAVLAVDLPSGLHASTGLPLGVCIRADVTATFGLAKVGQLITPGCTFVGDLQVVDIGLPRSVTEAAPPPMVVLDEAEVASLVQPRPMTSHKGSFGHVLVVAGSVGKSGAAAMTGLGAARAGAGLVTVAVPASLNPVLEVKLTEVMTEPLPETPAQTISEAAWARLQQLLANKQALALGPGLSMHEETRSLVCKLVEQGGCPLVVDADGVNSLAGQLAVLERAQAPLVLTPHPGEMGRLVGLEAAAVQEQRLELSRSFSRKYGVTLVLKGARTIVAHRDGRVAINVNGNPGLASGGSGDVLTGLIAGFLAQGLAAFEAACLGVFCHGAAADQAKEHLGCQGMIATDLLEQIPKVLSRLAEIDV